MKRQCAGNCTAQPRAPLGAKFAEAAMRSSSPPHARRAFAGAKYPPQKLVSAEQTNVANQNYSNSKSCERNFSTRRWGGAEREPAGGHRASRQSRRRFPPGFCGNGLQYIHPRAFLAGHGSALPTKSKLRREFAAQEYSAQTRARKDAYSPNSNPSIFPSPVSRSVTTAAVPY